MARFPHWRDTVIASRGDLSHTAMTVRGIAHLAEGRPRGFNALSDRYELRWIAGARGKPGINGDILSATEGTREIADPDFEVLGTNASSSSTALNAEGGVTATTGAGDDDQVIILPHLDASQTAWSATTWGTDKAPEWECFIATTADITATAIWAGLKLTNTSVVATDADQCFFRFSDEEGANWMAVSSRANVDTTTSTGVAVAASTKYHLAIKIDTSRVPRFYINGQLVVTGAALVTEKDFIPYIGVQATTTDATAITIFGQAISRIAG